MPDVEQLQVHRIGSHSLIWLDDLAAAFPNRRPHTAMAKVIAKNPDFERHFPNKKGRAGATVRGFRLISLEWPKEEREPVLGLYSKARSGTWCATHRSKPKAAKPKPETKQAPPQSDDPPEEMAGGETIPPEPEPENVGSNHERALTIPERFRRIDTICKAIPGTIGERECDVVDAEDLWHGLEVNTPFRDWVRRKVEENSEFTEGVDYQRADVRTAAGGTKAKVVLLTLKTSRKVSMAERSAVGNLVRDYYCWTEGIVEEVVANPAGLGNQQLADILARMEARDARQEARDTAVDARFEQMMSLILADNHRQPHAFSGMSAAPIRTTRRRGQMSITQYRGHAKSILGVKVQYAWIEDLFVRKGWAERGVYLDKLLATDAGVESGYLVNFSSVVRDEDGSEKAYPSTLHLTERGVEWLSGVLRGRNPDIRQSDFFREDADRDNLP